MRRNARNRNNVSEDVNTKIIKYASIGVGILTIIVVGLLMYSQNLNDEVKQGTLSSEQLASLVNKTSENTGSTESASTEMGKSVNEAKNELNNTTNETNSTNSVENKTTNNTLNTTNTTNSNKNNTSTLVTGTKETTTKQQTPNGTANTTNNTKNSTENTTNNTEKSATSKELKFEKPVDGEIVKEFAKDNLLYSETLQEWTIHTGIDISAEKTAVVKSSEAGKVKSIKNDPRYGLTIVVEHENGFETVYANLLSSEFVVEGEKVEKGQSLGTVGNTAVFEIADEPHLHFEILKDSVQVDPSIYLK